MYAWTQTGLPIVRPLFLNDPDDPAVYAYLNDQFFLGRDILVAPILAPAANAGGAARRNVYLPTGIDWYALGDHDQALGPPMPGGRLLEDVEAGLDQMPVFVRAGAIVPLRSRDEQYVGELAHNPLMIVIYPGPDREYLLYQDDGMTTQAEATGAFRTTRITRRGVPGGTGVRLERFVDGYAPAEPFLFIRLLQMQRPETVTVEGKSLRDAASLAALDAAAADAYVWDEGQAAVTIKVFTASADLSVTVLFAAQGSG